MAVCDRGAAGARAWRRTWPSRPTPRRRAGARGGPRPTGQMRGCSVTCWPRAGSRSAGSRRRTCWSAGRCWSAITTCGPSTPPGCSASTRCCSTRAPRSSMTSAVRTRRPSWPSWLAATCRRPGRCRSAPACGCWPRWKPSWTRIRRRLLAAARHLRGAKVLAESIYGVGPVTGLALTCWLGGAGRFTSARKAVRFAGLDITVYSSDGKRSPGHLSRQGPPVLRWALYEAGKTHARAAAPDTATTPPSRTARTASAPPSPRPARSSAGPATSWPSSATTPSPWCER